MKSSALILVVLTAAGCAGRYNVGVNGFTISGQPLIISPVASVAVIEDSNAANPFLEKEVAVKIRKLLGRKGLSTAPDEPDYYLLFEYGIDSGRTVAGSRAVYEPGDIVTVNTTGTYGGTEYSRSSTIFTPGYTTYVPYSATVYTRWMVLKLVDAASYRQDPRKPKPVWIGEIVSVGPESDLRDAINYMLIAAFEYFGQSTGRRVTVSIRKGDQRVAALVGP